mmetsp:Transcript_28699/g.39654  ORF Transcript_28699/g.39654 Transcript_28699/m.39654 type:complete len:251 (-) Transcript_28699:188-940(-)
MPELIFTISTPCEDLQIIIISLVTSSVGKKKGCWRKKYDNFLFIELNAFSLNQFSNYQHVGIRKNLTKNLMDAKDEGIEPFMGCKTRRRSSVHKNILRGDHLDLSKQPEVVSLLAKEGDRSVLLTTNVFKLMRLGVLERRTLLLTERFLYLLHPDNLHVIRLIPHQDIERIQMSELADNFVAIMVPRTHDLLLVCSHKVELARQLSLSNPNITFSFTNRMEYKAGADNVKCVDFSLDEVGNVKTKFYPKE